MSLLVVAAALVAMRAAGVVSGAGATMWDVYPGGSIQDAIDGAGDERVRKCLYECQRVLIADSV